MTVRTFTARLTGGSNRRRGAFGCILLVSIALLGLYGAITLSGVKPPGLTSGGAELRRDDGWRPRGVPPSMLRIVRPLSADHLESLADQAGFDLAAVRSGKAEVPWFYVRHLPGDLRGITETSRRKRLFLTTLLPLVLIANEELRADRERVLELSRRAAGGAADPSMSALSGSERRWLAAVRTRYGTAPDDWTGLLLRLDEVPVSLVMAQAVQESGWGTSRFAREGNALFGQRTWDAGMPGLVPDRRADGETYRVRVFTDLMASIRAYVHNINTHDAYRELRIRRAGFRERPVRRPGIELASTLTRYSEENAGYVKALTGLIRDNALSELNNARLRMTPDRVASRSGGNS